MATIEFNGKPLNDFTEDDVKAVPTPLLIGMLKFHCRHHGAKAQVHQLPWVIAEGRRRLVNHWALEQLDPKPCYCGKAGLYIVGKKTFCREHKDVATGLLSEWRNNNIEKKSTDIDSAFTEFDKRTKESSRWRRSKSRWPSFAARKKGA